MPINRVRPGRGTKRKRKGRSKRAKITAYLIAGAVISLFTIWAVVSFRTLALTGQSMQDASGTRRRLPSGLSKTDAEAALESFVGKGKEAISAAEHAFEERRHHFGDSKNAEHGAPVGQNHIANVPPKVVSSSPRTDGLKQYQSPLLIFTCSRAQYLTTTLELIFEYLPNTCYMGCPIVVSQDRNDVEVTKAIQTWQKQFEAKGIPFYHIQHPAAPNLRGNPYQLLAIHYGWALKTLFDGKAYDKYDTPDRVIILEEDLKIAPDFFGYFEATAPLLDKDPKLLAVSAFNDNGYVFRVSDNKRLLRSDFFPGLGWMMTAKTWKEDLGPKWPKGYWDDWLREPDQRKGRQIIRPEVTRTFHFGEKGGASQNQFGSSHIRVFLNQEKVDWTKENLSYLEAENFDQQYAKLVADADLVEAADQALERAKKREVVRVEYQGISGFAKLAHHFSLMADEKAGVFRTAYKGVVETRPFGEVLLFLTPKEDELRASFGNNWPR